MNLHNTRAKIISTCKHGQLNTVYQNLMVRKNRKHSTGEKQFQFSLAYTETTEKYKEKNPHKKMFYYKKVTCFVNDLQRKPLYRTLLTD